VVKAPTDAPDRTALPDVLPNLGDFEAHLRAGNLSALTIKSYSQAVHQLDAFLAGRGMPRTVAGIRREHVEAFIEDQLARLRPASAANRYRSIQQFWRFLIDEGEVQTSPMARMKPPIVPEEPPELVSLDQWKALEKVTSGTSFDERRDRAILAMFNATGMRLAELSGLRLADIDVENQTNEVTVLGKGRRPRTVRFDPKAALDLRRYLKVRRLRDDAGSPWLWLGKKGRLGPTGVGQMLKRRCREAGIPQLHAHLFRHTYADDQLSQGVAEGDLMRNAGWKSRQMLGRYGAIRADARAREAYKSPRNRA
jgi:site-specific recombinase XerD